MRSSKGFTLIEMVVVLAVVAILAAILVPTIAKNINDAKVTRASNECLVISAAMASFYKDMGRWPVGNGAAAGGGTDAINLLRTLNGMDATNFGGSSGLWLTSTPADTFENQLVRNLPGGATAYYTPTTAAAVGLQDYTWRGPYLSEIKPDPWGTRYYCNAQQLRNVAVNAAWVLSAGPNKVIQTNFTQVITAAASPRLNNNANAANPADDIGSRIQ